MSAARTVLLGFIAGVTIILGLPIGRLRRPRANVGQFLCATAVGVLVFLLWDVLAHAWEPVDAALAAFHDGTGGLASVIGYGTLLAGGLLVGLMSLVKYEAWMARDSRPRSVGAMAVGTATGTRLARPSGRQLAVLIAVGIGLHNFGEGLAIGQSAATGAISLATVLVVGFALHNATEGFGIVAPMAADGDRPTWRFLLLLALIGGGPTVIGTIVGRQFTSDPARVIFLALAGGSILYVVIQLLTVAQRAARREPLYWGVLLGLLAGFVTDMVVTAGGA